MVGVSVEASSARGVVELNLSRVANGVGSASAAEGSQTGGQMRRERCKIRTVIDALQPSLGLAVCALSHSAMLSIRVRLEGLHTWTGRCLPLDWEGRVSAQ